MLATIVIIGLLVGLSTYRDALVQELGDSAAGVASLQQSFSIEPVEILGSYGSIPFDATVSGSVFEDAFDAGEAVLDVAGQAPMCIEMTAATILNER